MQYVCFEEGGFKRGQQYFQEKASILMPVETEAMLFGKY